jgi:hypothetical protein
VPPLHACRVPRFHRDTLEPPALTLTLASMQEERGFPLPSVPGEGRGEGFPDKRYGTNPRNTQWYSFIPDFRPHRDKQLPPPYHSRIGAGFAVCVFPVTAATCIR